MGDQLPIGVQFIKNLNENLSLADTDTKKDYKFIYENEVLTDLLSKVITGQIPIGVQFVKHLSENLSLTDSETKKEFKTIFETENLTDSDIKKLSRIILDNITLTDTKNGVKLKYLSETMSLSDSALWVLTTQKILTKRLQFQKIILDNGFYGTLTRSVQTQDTMGGLTINTDSVYNIFCMIQDIILNDRQIIDMGLAIPGNVKGFFYNEYPSSMTGSINITPKVGDIITDRNNNSWRLEQILGAREMNQNVLFISAILKKINLQ